MKLPPRQLPLALSLSRQLHLNNPPWNTTPRKLPPKKFLATGKLASLPPPNGSPWGNHPTGSCPIMKFFPGQLPPRIILPGQLPLDNCSFSNSQPGHLMRSVSSWVVLSLNFTLREASITNGDPCRGGIVSPLLPPWPFFTFFFNLV